MAGSMKILKTKLQIYSHGTLAISTVVMVISMQTHYNYDD